MLVPPGNTFITASELCFISIHYFKSVESGDEAFVDLEELSSVRILQIEELLSGEVLLWKFSIFFALIWLAVATFPV